VRVAVAEQKEDSRERTGRAGATRRRGGSWRRGDEERRETGFFPGLRVGGWLAAFCSSLCGYRWAGYSTVCVRKMKIFLRLQNPLGRVL
jgi:hypothetical protein